MAEISPPKTRSIDSVDELGSDTDFNLRGSFEVLHFPEGEICYLFLIKSFFFHAVIFNFCPIVIWMNWTWKRAFLQILDCFLLDSDHISVTRQSSVMDVSNEAPPTPTSFEKRNHDGNNSSFEDLTTIGQSSAASSK